MNYNRYQEDANKRIEEKDLISFDGVMYGQATMSEQEIIREELAPKYNLQKTVWTVDTNIHLKVIELIFCGVEKMEQNQ